MIGVNRVVASEMFFQAVPLPLPIEKCVKTLAPVPDFDIPKHGQSNDPRDIAMEDPPHRFRFGDSTSANAMQQACNKRQFQPHLGPDGLGEAAFRVCFSILAC